MRAILDLNGRATKIIHQQGDCKDERFDKSNFELSHQSGINIMVENEMLKKI